MIERIPLPDDVSASTDGLDLTVEGPAGSVTRRLWFPDITVRAEDDAVVIDAADDDTETRATVGTFASHVRNAVRGVQEPWEYRMEAVYSHFPMQVSVEDDAVVVENFLGERAPRRAAIRGDTEAEVDGDELVLRGPDKEDVGQTAANVEQLTTVPGKDTRVFQDGVYITDKPATEAV